MYVCSYLVTIMTFLVFASTKVPPSGVHSCVTLGCDCVVQDWFNTLDIAG
eukprot:SAG11_NODE_7483_length_1138_cov_1.157844_1_plen_49_part_10